MKELNEIVSSTIGEMVSSGKVEALISEKMEASIAACINETFKEYGDFGTAVKEAIKTSIGIDGFRVDLPEYNNFIRQVAAEEFSKYMHENASKQLADMIGDVLPPPDRKSSFQTVMNKIQEQYTDYCKENGLNEIRVSEENSKNAKYVVIKNPNGCEETRISFYNWDDDGWHIGYINHDSKVITGSYYNKPAVHLDQLERWLFQCYVMRTTFEDDTEFYSIEEILYD